MVNGDYLRKKKVSIICLIIISILLMRKLRLRDIKEYVHGQTGFHSRLSYS